MCPYVRVFAGTFKEEDLRNIHERRGIEKAQI
jgi:hypothetical protein